MLKLTSSSLKAVDTNSTYQWINCNGNVPVSGATNQSFTPTATGNYAVVLTNGRCTDTSSCHNVVVSTIGITESELDGIVLFPNPFTDVISLKFSSTLQSGTVTVINLTGQVIQTREFENKENLKINLAEEPNGFYFVQVTSAGKTRTFRIIKN